MNNAEDTRFMRLALREARKGLGKTSPNPCVGAVIVRNGEVIAKGYHKKAGAPHAEINAINQARSPLAGATLYVTLEPCNHTGKTPPCTQALVEQGIARVVIGMKDPNPLVNGQGIAFLQSKGVAVTSGLLEQQCVELNGPFLKHIRTGLPQLIMKAGVSLDGRLNYLQGKSGWITGQKSILESHRLRDRVDGILVGSNTVVVDNPALTTRLPKKRTKNPIRIILDSRLSTSLTSEVYLNIAQTPTWVFHSENVSVRRIAEFEALGIRLFSIEEDINGINLLEVVKILGREGLNSVMVEGGGKVHGAFLKAQLFDYAYLFYAPVFAGDDGVSLIEGVTGKDQQGAPKLVPVHYKRLGDDMLISGRIAYG